MIFTTNKMLRGNKVINDVIAQFERLVDKVESGIIDLKKHKEKNDAEMVKMQSENTSIDGAIEQAEKVKANLKKIFA